jgi:hypothetical protein
MKYLIIFAILAYLYNRYIYQPMKKMESASSQKSFEADKKVTHADEYIDYEELK